MALSSRSIRVSLLIGAPYCKFHSSRIVASSDHRNPGRLCGAPACTRTTARPGGRHQERNIFCWHPSPCPIGTGSSIFGMRARRSIGGTPIGGTHVLDQDQVSVSLSLPRGCLGE